VGVQTVVPSTNSHAVSTGCKQCNTNAAPNIISTMGLAIEMRRPFAAFGLLTSSPTLVKASADAFCSDLRR
jgi:hypothetical protein